MSSSPFDFCLSKRKSLDPGGPTIGAGATGSQLSLASDFGVGSEDGVRHRYHFRSLCWPPGGRPYYYLSDATMQQRHEKRMECQNRAGNSSS